SGPVEPLPPSTLICAGRPCSGLSTHGMLSPARRTSARVPTRTRFSAGMTKSSAAGQDTISVGESVDLIPMVPHLLGFSPQESLVVLCFHGKRLGPLMRVDLPPLDEAAETAEYLAAQSRRHGDRVALFAFSAHPDAP